MWLLIKKIWVFLSEFSGVFTTIGMALFGIKSLYGLLSTSKLGIIFFFGLMFIAITASFKWVKTNLRRINSIIRKKEIKNDLESFSKLKSQNIDITTILPDHNLLIRWLDESREKTASWSDDVKISIINFYIDVKNVAIEPLLQVYFVSDWNKEALTIYIGKDYDQKYSEVEYDLFKTKTGIVQPFFIKYPNWNVATKKAYSMLKNKLPSIFKIQLYQSVSNFQIIFNYIQGKVERSETFVFNGTTLNNVKTNQSITIS